MAGVYGCWFPVGLWNVMTSASPYQWQSHFPKVNSAYISWLPPALEIKSSCTARSSSIGSSKRACPHMPTQHWDGLNKFDIHHVRKKILRLRSILANTEYDERRFFPSDRAPTQHRKAIPGEGYWIYPLEYLILGWCEKTPRFFIKPIRSHLFV